MPYILNTEKDVKEMLGCLGISSVEDLFSHIPSSLKLKEPLGIGPGLSELGLKRELKVLAEKNKTIDKFNSFLGAGCYDHYIPAGLKYLLSNSKFVTAYTPYQAECSQGILQAIYEYQSYICLLTGMEVSNASLLDGASAFAEAVLMSMRISKKSRVLVSASINPQYRKTLETYLSGLDCSVELIPFDKDGLIDLAFLSRSVDDGACCFALQSPNYFGLVEDAAESTRIIKKSSALSVMITNPLSLAIFKEPGLLGMDIVCGDGQPLGGGLRFGGPSFGFLASREAYLRQLPGRIVGRTVDKDNNPAFCLTLATREQHIKREKATSNICSNQSLNVIAATIYLAFMGEAGLKDAAGYSFSNAQYLYKRIKEVRGVNMPYGQGFFNEFIWEVKDPEAVLNKLYQKNIIAGHYIGNEFEEHKNCILSCCTEKKTKKDIDDLVNTLAEVLHG
ncbi:MAG: aminomethyl-transferring glycine dehydrogenase subunit GcvPA [Candidatus Omnitrophica bacterium]|nr:aminomethyl-transferring glycine dehydrogenase subunit GcvPA [Candidatus Omnitrophota bacterium]